MSSKSAFSIDLGFDINVGTDVGVAHADTTEYETSGLVFLNVGLLDAQGGVDE
jgi:hypothetical protein